MRIMISRGLLILISLTCTSGNGGDWPQILGPHRNGVAIDEKIADVWPESGPQRIWDCDVGSGFSGVAVSAGKVVLFHRVGNEDRIEARQANTGKKLWEVLLPTRYQPQISEDDGPLCVPTIAEGIAVCFGANGRLTAIELESGRKLWSRPLAEEYGAPSGYFGAGSSPIVVEGRVLLNLGADRKEAGLIALNLKTGETLWAKGQEQASYSSPIQVSLGTDTDSEKSKSVIFVTRLNVVAVDPATGSESWKYPFGKRGPTVNAATPVLDEGNLFVTSSYDIGGVYARISRKSAVALWSNEAPFSSQFTTPVPAAGAWFGIDGRKDVGVGTLRAVSLKTREVHWSESGFGVGHLIVADGKLIILKDEGELVLVRANPKKYEPLSRYKLQETLTRAIPAISEGLLYVRGNQKLTCFDLR